MILGQYNHSVTQLFSKNLPLKEFPAEFPNQFYANWDVSMKDRLDMCENGVGLRYTEPCIICLGCLVRLDLVSYS